jgi:membrane protein YdbS with pleckstrin-like domain
VYKRSSSLVLRWLKVPDEPHPPFGDPTSLRVFRAGKNYFNLRLVGWGVTQVLALAGIIFWLWVFIGIEQGVNARRHSGQAPVTPLSAKTFEEYIKKIGADEKAPEPPAVQPGAGPGRESPAAPEPAKKKRVRVRIAGWAGFQRMLVELSLYLPTWSFPVLWGLKVLGFVVYLVQVPMTYAVRRLDYEMRWYMVTDRSLRIRHGVWKISESTMSFANIQQVIVSQNPIQRLLGLSDVRVQSAGGGSGHHEHHQHGDHDMHLGLFHSVTNAPEIRDLILERLRRFRESGLGDPEEKARQGPTPIATSEPASSDLLAAARELAAEARALRVSLG